MATETPAGTSDDSAAMLPRPTQEQAARAARERAALLQAIGKNVTPDCDGTKVYSHALSPGCRSCAQGNWSCLFINGLCNRDCFFCPSPQVAAGEPQTAGLSFPGPRDYLDYLEFFHFRGVSISGGEPLLTSARTLRFLEAVRKGLERNVHIWLYTNGSLLTDTLLHQLRDVGLDELRLNLHAAGYGLEALRQAVKIIPTVTVEIPAIPEEEAQMQRLLPVLDQAGVAFLNLRQLRCTPYNHRHLRARGYTAADRTATAVLESELTALRLLHRASASGLALPVHYCSFAYRNRFQRLGARLRCAPLVTKPFETLTRTGLIRTLTARDDPSALASRRALLNRDAQNHKTAWRQTEDPDRLQFHPDLWDHVVAPGCTVSVSYAVPVLRPRVSYTCPFREIRLRHGRQIVIERQPLFEKREIKETECDGMRTFIRDGTGAGSLPPDLREMECPRSGFGDVVFSAAAVPK